MTWNADAKESGLVMGTWYWYRHSPTSKPFPVWIFDSVGLEYAWLSDPHSRQCQTVRVKDCKGEFLTMLEPPQ